MMILSRRWMLAYFALLVFAIMAGSFLGVVVGEMGGSVTNLPGPWERLFVEGYVPHDHGVE